jgi:hypothetical protein
VAVEIGSMGADPANVGNGALIPEQFFGCNGPQPRIRPKAVQIVWMICKMSQQTRHAVDHGVTSPGESQIAKTEFLLPGERTPLKIGTGEFGEKIVAAVLLSPVELTV